ncbi:MAG: hypothetical protein V4437_00090 [Patescibacteria group bacterium]
METSIRTNSSTVSTPSVNFWDWLFGGNNSVSATSTSAVQHAGTFGFVTDAAVFVGGIIGAIISFLWSIYSFLAYTLSGVLVLVIVSALVGLFFIRLKEGAKYAALPPAETAVHPLRERWQSLLAGAMSNDPKRWREGILEADVMLGELLGHLGYAGQSTAEQIRMVPENAFVTVPLAWEAHRIRNFVSAPSSNFILTQREAFHAMKLYEQVFEEFDFI